MPSFQNYSNIFLTSAWDDVYKGVFADKWAGKIRDRDRITFESLQSIRFTWDDIATAKAVRTAQRLKSPLVLQSPPVLS
ncbi:hypothetical protein [Chamaesiphon sp.]|uniref:hypothetical protein n=1 Tax=Chamaesiphon sp. TaxID=2814140 RepID=UPI0035937080